ncbi:hypothetical protein CH063_15163 [Colletotrichum higginsianum]|uniref:Uncharacterized protein n=1 Tax=Colletotrichum higginsianum (strain IMI 349063) TaxID=759273 RepID=H1W1N7_COLHI|nr:hypothetical protein CH063_15163 [Colletotrichum higginsianum]
MHIPLATLTNRSFYSVSQLTHFSPTQKSLIPHVIPTNLLLFPSTTTFTVLLQIASIHSFLLLLDPKSAFTENEVVQTLEAIANGQSLRRLKGCQPRPLGFADLQRLNISQEAKLVEWV